MKKRLLFVVNTTEFFISHRLPIALAALRDGYEVHIATGTAERAEELYLHGLTHHLIPISRSQVQPLQECRSMAAIWRLMKYLNPDIVHLVTIKPVLYGGIAARLANKPSVVTAISGLGTVFSDNGIRNRFIRFIVTHLYRFALNHKRLKVIFQNKYDQKLLADACRLTDDQMTLIPGSGVSLEDYPYLREPDGVPVITFAARLIKEKGPYEFVEAARIIKKRGLTARFWLLGGPDPGNPNRVSERDISDWQEEKIVEVLGQTSHVAEYFSQSNIICLPSYYGEGLPKVLIEAAASGRAVVTTDHPGCRDAVLEGKTGLIVPIRNAVALADAIEKLIEFHALRSSMGKAARQFAEEQFTIEKVVKRHLLIYRQLMKKKQSS